MKTKKTNNMTLQKAIEILEAYNQTRINTELPIVEAIDTILEAVKPKADEKSNIDFAIEQIHKLLKEYHLQNYNLMKSGGKMQGIDFHALNFINELKTKP